MQKTLLILGIIFSVACKGQSILIDTILVRRIIADTDSLERLHIGIKSIIVRKNIHNETTFSQNFVFDTATLRILKFDYLILTVATLNDSLLEKSSFYTHSDQFVAVYFRRFRNGTEVGSQLFYLESQNGEVKSIYPDITQSPLTPQEIKYQASDLWSAGVSIKEWIRKKNGG